MPKEPKLFSRSRRKVFNPENNGLAKRNIDVKKSQEVLDFLAKQFGRNKKNEFARRSYLDAIEKESSLRHERSQYFLKEYGYLIAEARQLITEKKYSFRQSSNFKDTLDVQLYLFRLVRLMVDLGLHYDARELVRPITSEALQEKLLSLIV